MGSLKNILWTLVIGFVAGIAPFVAMGIIPGILNPQVQLPPISFGTIALLGLLIGAVTSILYSKSFDDTPTRDSLLYGSRDPGPARRHRQQSDDSE